MWNNKLTKFDYINCTLFIVLVITMYLFPIALICIGLFIDSHFEDVDWARWVIVGLGVIEGIILYGWTLNGIYRKHKKSVRC